MKTQRRKRPKPEAPEEIVVTHPSTTIFSSDLLTPKRSANFSLNSGNTRANLFVC
jgi:hypothetical protein